MILDTAINDFLNRYNREMIQSIEDMSKGIGYRENNFTMPAFDMKSAFSKFETFLCGYADYKIKNINNPNAVDQDTILENSKTFIDKETITDCAIKYPELPQFIADYLNGIKCLTDTCCKVKCDMEHTEGLDHAYIGAVDDIVTYFVEKVQAAFYPVMDNMVTASGYRSNELLHKCTGSSKKPLIV